MFFTSADTKDMVELIREFLMRQEAFPISVADFLGLTYFD